MEPYGFMSAFLALHGHCRWQMAEIWRKVERHFVVVELSVTYAS